MEHRYPAIYRDAHGTERTDIVNDGATLSMRLRGEVFTGESFDDFEPAGEGSGFQLNKGFLCSCEIECSIPMEIVANGGSQEGTLKANLKLGAPAANGGLDEELLVLRLTIGEQTYQSSGGSGWFEDELLELQRKLPGAYMRACIGCAFSDYSPLGRGLFGGLACFRDSKDLYRRVNSKQALFDAWDTMSEFVQETHVCGQFERRKPGTGYRG